MKTQFLVLCDTSFHEGSSALIRSFTVSTASGINEIGLHPLGRNADSQIVQVLLIDNSPARFNFEAQHLESFVNSDRARNRQEFECECGMKVVMRHEKFEGLVKKLMENGVSQISLTSLDKYSSS